LFPSNNNQDMSSKHVDTRPQQPAKAPFSSFTPDEHLNWALKWNTGNEHVTFPKRFKDKSTAIVVNGASVIVQEAGLKQVNSNIQRHLNRQGPNNLKTDGRNRDYLFHEEEEIEEGGDEVSFVNFKAATPVVLEVAGNSSNSGGDEPTDALDAHSHDQDHDSALWSEETATVEAAESVLGDIEREALLSIVEKASHRVCEWIVNGICVACRFQEFQQACIESLVNNEIRKTEVADAMAIIGVFAPSMSTRRMEKAFSKKLLCALAKSAVELPDVDFDDSAMMKAVRLYIKEDKDNAADVLYSLPKKDRKIRLMLETLPNTEPTTQKRQGLKADRPDIRAVAFEKEVCWGEVTGPAQETNTAKNQWDTYRLARFGKAFLDEGHAMAPLIQIIYSNASYLRLSAKTRGLMLLEEVGTFVIPTTTATIPSLFATIPTLLVAKADIQKISDGDLHGLKRSWGYKDLKNAKTRLI
ncbi:hypothetical protein BGZ58_003285, partial [Dissophora ornata]